MIITGSCVICQIYAIHLPLSLLNIKGCSPEISLRLWYTFHFNSNCTQWNFSLEWIFIRAGLKSLLDSSKCITMHASTHCWLSLLGWILTYLFFPLMYFPFKSMEMHHLVTMHCCILLHMLLRIVAYVLQCTFKCQPPSVCLHAAWHFPYIPGTILKKVYQILDWFPHGLPLLSLLIFFMSPSHCYNWE